MLVKHLLALALLTTASVLFPVINAAAQPMKIAAEPQATEITGFTEAMCRRVTKALRVCKAMVDTEEQPDSVTNGKFLIQKNEQTTFEWNIDVSAFTSLEAFDVLYGNLDRDASPELVVADMFAQGNGMGVKSYNVKILADPLTRGFREVTEFTAEDFNARGSVVYDRQLGENLLLQTKWEWYEHLEPRRVPGLYFVGRYLHLRRGALEPVKGKPILARRYLFSFDAERTALMNDETGELRRRSRYPFSWLSHRTTRKLSVDPDLKKTD